MKIVMIAAMLLAPLSASAATAFDPSLVVRPSAVSCLTGATRVVKLPAGNDTLKVSAPANTVLDLRGRTVTGQGNSSSGSVLSIKSFTNSCLLGGRLVGKQDPQVVPWVVGHSIYGAGLQIKGTPASGQLLIEQMIIENSLQDGINISGSLPNTTSFGVRGVMILNTSDDGIQNDGGKKIDFIEDSLIEAKMGLSIRPGADSNYDPSAGFTIPIRNTLWNIICVADDRPDGSDRRDPVAARKNNCGPSRAAASMFKWYGPSPAGFHRISNAADDRQHCR